MKKAVVISISFLMFISCTSKKQIVYLNGIEKEPSKNITNQKNLSTIQPDDVLRIEVYSMIPEAAAAYNKIPRQINSSTNISLLQLEGYLVSADYTINFPVLGVINVKGTVIDLEKKILKKLLEGEHLINPTVSARLLNGKFTVLGEVAQPGTYSFLETNLTILQALGYAGDLTINSKRKNIILIREVDGIQSTIKIDATSVDFLHSPAYYIRNNDVIIVNPNFNRIKSAGFIGSPQSIASIASILLSVTLLVLNK